MSGRSSFHQVNGHQVEIVSWTHVAYGSTTVTHTARAVVLSPFGAAWGWSGKCRSAAQAMAIALLDVRVSMGLASPVALAAARERAGT